jgi:hypothetical protein
MTENDDWGRDPSVQRMRRLFRAMEEAQQSLLEGLHVSPFDARLRSWRERARMAFEAAYARGAQAGLPATEEEAADLYIRSFRKILVSDGIEVPEDIFPCKDPPEKLLKETLS